MNVEISIDFQFLIHVIIEITVMTKSHYCYQLLTERFPAPFCTIVMHGNFMYYNFVLSEHLGSEQLFELSHSANDNSSLRPGIYMNLFFVTYKFIHL
jgi:hypothetical protein